VVVVANIDIPQFPELICFSVLEVCVYCVGISTVMAANDEHAEVMKTAMILFSK
jgi:uncharacterized protein YebE (UPF0316 family)